MTLGPGITRLQNRLIGGNPTPLVFGFPDDTQERRGVGDFGPTFRFRNTPGPASDPTAAPEPAGLAVLGLGVAGLVGRGWGRRRSAA